MKIEMKNMWYMLVWVLLASLLFNTSFATKIYSNLSKWFEAITYEDPKVQNKLVWLDSWWKLPTDIIPASALWTTWWSVPEWYCQTTMIQKNELSNATIECWTGRTSIKLSAYWRAHPTGIWTPGWSNFNTSVREWQGNRYVLTQCCVPEL